MKDTAERRTYATELRVDAGGYGKKTPTIKGYAAKFNTLSSPMPIIEDDQQIGTFREQLMPGCFRTAIVTSDIRMLINHDPNLILGRNVSGTLRMVEDDVGLSFENDPPETSFSKDIQVSMKRGDVSQCSFGFSVASGGDEYRKDPEVANGYIRSINSVEKMFDLTIATFPQYNDTNCAVAVRSIVSQIRDEEKQVADDIKAQKEEERSHASYIRNKQLELAERTIVR